LLFDREIKGALTKLERLAALLPDEDPNKEKSLKDYEMLNNHWAELHMKEGSNAADDNGEPLDKSAEF